jgi:hypothetical protein
MAPVGQRSDSEVFPNILRKRKTKREQEGTNQLRNEYFQGVQRL